MEKKFKILEIDPYLAPFEKDVNLRMERLEAVRARILKGKTLSEFASAHEYFGFHKIKGGYVYREEAPNAKALFLTGDFNGWSRRSHPLSCIGNGVWEIEIKTDKDLNHTYVKVIVLSDIGEQDRIPLYIRYASHDDAGGMCGRIYFPEKKLKLVNKKFKLKSAPIIYECHIGMAGEKEGISGYADFKNNILPYVRDLGYNTLQIMAVMEHPYYASFGYQVSNFFAPCSRFGTPDELKELIEEAHKKGIAVLLDVVHSHAVKNTLEGINLFDGTEGQFFEGDHPAWGSKVFDYSKENVLRFLLSNIKYYMEEIGFDGFRFDGVTSMLYKHFGLGTAFSSYDKYFSPDTNIDAVNYLQLATTLMKEINPDSIAIAEDMSGMPGMCLSVSDGGIGFDYRLTMGVPDMWTKLIEDAKDEDWSMFKIYHELTSKRPKEKAIAYAESHDQALVGDKTVIFRLADKEMYFHMRKDDDNLVIDRAISLYKLIYMITFTAGGDGYLSFMGNEFGHPEWIDFPREGNNWSYKYARRLWSLAFDKSLKYEYLLEFTRTLIKIGKECRVFDCSPKELYIDDGRKIIAFEKNDYVFVFDFHPDYSEKNMFIPTNKKGVYELVFTTDDKVFGGFDRVKKGEQHETVNLNGYDGIAVYCPSRCGFILKKVR